MKEFDVEKLERKNIYKTPDGFFERMQEKVVAETQQKSLKERGRIVKMNWVYAAAAAVTLFFGITFLVNQNNTAITDFGSDAAIANSSIGALNQSQSVSKLQNESVISAPDEQLRPTPSIPQNKENEKPATLVASSENSMVSQKTIAAKVNPEGQVDQVLANFSNTELADLSRTAEQDIYLDLYN